MEILTFKVKGKFAHFRKYFANNTAFSFTIPPRTTLMGLTAAIMGWDKDAYYEKLSSANIHYGVRVLSPLKKSFQRLNYLSIKSTGDLSKSFDSDFRGRGGRIQTPFEVVSAHNISKDEVCYQIFLAADENGLETFDKIVEQVLNQGAVFNISLGPANFQAGIFNEELIEDENITKNSYDGYLHVHSAIPSKFVEELEFNKKDYDQYNFVEEDMLPGDFLKNNSREVSEMNRVLFSTTNFPLRIITNSHFWKVKTKDETLNIQFMDM